MNAAIFAGFGFIPVDTGNSGLVDTDEPVHEINVGKHEGYLLRRSEACEKAKRLMVLL